MELSNTERVQKALELLREGLRPMCESTWQGFYGEGWLQEVTSKLHGPKGNLSTDDVSFLLNGIKATWNEVFRQRFDPSVRSLVFELSNARNAWAHQQAFSDDDAWRALDSMERVLRKFSVDDQRDNIRRVRQDLFRKMKSESINNRPNTTSKHVSKVRYPPEETTLICGALPDQIDHWVNGSTFLIPQSEFENPSYLRFDFLNLIEIKVIQQLLIFGFLAEQMMPYTDSCGWELSNFLFVSSDGDIGDDLPLNDDDIGEVLPFDPEDFTFSDNPIKVPEYDNDPDIGRPFANDSEVDPQNVHNYIDLESDDWYVVINLYKIRKDLVANLIELHQPIPAHLDVGNVS